MRLRRAPEEVRELAGADKALAWTQVAQQWLVATSAALVVPGRPQPLSWPDVVRAAWDDPVLEVQAPEGMYRFVLEEPGRIPQVVNERVKASVLVQHHVPLVGELGVRLVARRRPGSDEILWRVTFDPGLNPDDPQLRAAADDALSELRTSIGL